MEQRNKASVGDNHGLDGLAVSGPYVYWAIDRAKERSVDQPAERLRLETNCARNDPTCEPEYIELEGAPVGLAADGEHLYWSVNGEAPANPGNDLYRYDAASGELTDLAPDPEGNGAEVRAFSAPPTTAPTSTSSPTGCWQKGRAREPVRAIARKTSAVNAASTSSTKGRSASSPASSPRRSDDDFQDWKGGGAFILGWNSPKVSRVSADGRALLFTSTEKLTDYENEGMPALYLYRVGDPEPILCVSCNPTGVSPSGQPSLGHLARTEPVFEAGRPPSRVLSRNLSADGDRVFFETAEALVASDTNGEEGCPVLGLYRVPACQDVYEWEAKGEGSCESEAQNGGCLYLISSGKSADPSYLADASASGNDVFFFTRERLTDTDIDSFLDVYDARVGRWSCLAKPVPPPPCEGEACRGSGAPSPPVGSPTTPLFSGPGNPKPHHKKSKARKHHKSTHTSTSDTPRTRGGPTDEQGEEQ